MTDKTLAGLLSGIILIYLKRAFDIFNHELKKTSKPWTSLKDALYVFSLHLSKKLFFINIENPLPDYGRISCVVPQGLIVEPLLFLVYINAMPPAAKTNLFL